ncbi:SNF2 family DNA or RNA helicase [Peribacillus deserti]|uniref:SNF2 family DNA or RNA helicase n=1 Tax=Peribacillus deserti TaxID=673318 RepID=A0ABS2QC40_9BACI|nr:DEAD/DEAH box helicase [Peribacillus deserti]MBM7690721.1 SNF2 family DNA or RNA helicase [Peribacillus deserti]
MLNKTKIHIDVQQHDNGHFIIIGKDENNHNISINSLRKLIFTWDSSSFYGTMLDTKGFEKMPGVPVEAWSLLNVFGKETFNSFVEWEWSDFASFCLSTAHLLLDGFEKGVPVPDFARLQNDEAGWALPKSMLDEFDADFWEEAIAIPQASIGSAHKVQKQKTKDFLDSWYNAAVSQYLSKHAMSQDHWKRTVLEFSETRLDPEVLQAYFTEDRWQKWLKLIEDEKPFTTCLRITEPPDGDGPWILETMLRSKKDESVLIPFRGKGKKPPKSWQPFLPQAEEEVKGWASVVPSLQEGDTFKRELEESEAWEFLTNESEKLIFLGAEILLPSWWQAIRDASFRIKARVKSTPSSRGPSYVGLQALMDFDWRFSMNGVDFSEEDFQKMVEEKRRLIYVQGQWVKLDPSFIRQIQEMMKTADQKGLQLSDLLHQELSSAEDEEDTETDDPAEMLKIQFELNQELRKLMSSLRETKSIPLISPSEHLQGTLRPYQIQGLSWLYFLREHGFGACLADDMGLGKTVQIIAYLLKVQEENQQSVITEAEVNGRSVVKTSLIICPTSVLGNWQKELERFSPNLKVFLHYGSNRPKGDDFHKAIAGYDVVLTSYGITHQDSEELESTHWSSVILDEAQNIKNAGTKQSRAVRKLRGTHHIALTGTPMENRLSELWAIFDFINKGYLGTLGQFQEKYVAAIEREQQKDKIKELQNLIQPFLLRRTKKDKDVALNLPDKLEQKEFVPLTGEQASLYEQLVKDTFSEIEKLSAIERKGLILSLLGKLKQLCDHPSLYLKEGVEHNEAERSGKLEKLLELVDAVQEQGESCLIFTQYIGMGNMMKNLLEARFGLEVPFLNGSMPKAKRDTMIADFQEGKFPIFILSLKAGGTGLNLTAANHVIHYDRWWNPAVENQATDRAYRIGQKKFVHVHKLVSTGTLEEKIDAMLDKKQALNDEILQGETWLTELSDKELLDLVALS